MDEKQSSELSESNFEQKVIKAQKPVLVKFDAKWCAACKTLDSVLDQFIKECQDKIDVIKIDVDENQNIASKFHVMTLPTLLLFYQGKITNQIMGAVSINKLKKKLNEYL